MLEPLAIGEPNTVPFRSAKTIPAERLAPFRIKNLYNRPAMATPNPENSHSLLLQSQCISSNSHTARAYSATAHFGGDMGLRKGFVLVPHLFAYLRKRTKSKPPPESAGAEPCSVTRVAGRRRLR